MALYACAHCTQQTAADLTPIRREIGKMIVFFNSDGGMHRGGVKGVIGVNPPEALSLRGSGGGVLNPLP